MDADPTTPITDGAPSAFHPGSCSASFDGVHRKPIDRPSAMMFARGTKAPAARMGTMAHWEICPPIHTARMVRELHRASGEDLTGRRQGRMVVVGLSRDLSARWIMRCDCGDYEPRRAKAIKNPSNGDDCCTKCRQVIIAANCHHFHTTGRDLPQSKKI